MWTAASRRPLRQAGWAWRSGSASRSPSLSAAYPDAVDTPRASERADDLLARTSITADPLLEITDYLDGFGNICSRVVLPPGRTSSPQTPSSATAACRTGRAGRRAAPDPRSSRRAPRLSPRQPLLRDRPVSAISLGSSSARRRPAGRGCRRSATTSRTTSPSAIEHARATRTASDVYQERTGVCRDFAHLAVTFCRCMNIPARYVNGYLGDIGVPPDPAPMDFSAWFEVFLGDRWYTFDARHNGPRIGRIPIAAAATPPTWRSATVLGSPRSPASRCGPTKWPEYRAAWPMHRPHDRAEAS